MIYLLCPPQIATGGPESLHLLARELIRAGHDARMAYLPATENGTHPAYASYAVRTAVAVEDRAEHTIIAPEIWAWRLERFTAIHKVLWWLSVDNYLETRSPFDFAAPANAGVRQLVASAYAAAFVEAQGAPQTTLLSSYVHETFTDFTDDDAAAGREDLVVYNPKKGGDVVARLIAETPDLSWRPVEGLDRAGVAALLRRAKVYVDFGHHPGKERLPREAAVSGCCVLTGMKGSAGGFADVPIPPAYKVDDRQALSAAARRTVADTIRACLCDYPARRADFAPYRAAVRAEKAAFEAAVRAAFPAP